MGNSLSCFSPGLVKRCFKQEGEEGKKTKYINAVFYFGKGKYKYGSAFFSSVHMAPANGCYIPKDLRDFKNGGGTSSQEQTLALETEDEDTTASSVTVDPSIRTPAAQVYHKKV